MKVENVTINCSSHPQEAIAQTSIVPHATMAAAERTLQLSQVPIPYHSLLSSIETSSLKFEKGKKKSKSYSCHYCGHRSSQKQSLTQHVQSVHERLKPFECKWERWGFSIHQGPKKIYNFNMIFNLQALFTVILAATIVVQQSKTWTSMFKEYIKR